MECDVPTVELYVRSLQPDAPADSLADAVECLQVLDDDDVIEDFRVTVWGRQLPRSGPLAETDAVAPYRETVREIRAWADEAGVDIASLFETRVVDRDLDGASYRATVLPTCCLVERVDGEINSVTPHQRDGETHTVGDRLARLEASGGVTVAPADGDPSAVAD